jgi:hypothetical protein
LTDIVAANADALSHLTLSVTGLLERLGLAAAETLAWLRGDPPRDAAGNPTMDAATFAVVRRQKLLRWAAGAGTLVVIAVGLRRARTWWASADAPLSPTAAPRSLMHRLLRWALAVGKVIALLLGVRAGIEFAKQSHPAPGGDASLVARSGAGGTTAAPATGLMWT